ncbi:MFS transporter [Streptomyces sp. NBC_01716]|uniref:MFS transporter n=1 Tax=Streptomyces sp. NBC_01716 TaxID=2975917 RepID=UPI002E349FD1|nr:MFS transporter [Streptomyces sp. NBC_01716]
MRQQDQKQGLVGETAGATAGEPPDQKRWLTLMVIALAQLMIVLDGTIVNIALPSMQGDLGISDGDRQWAVIAYVLPFGGLLLLGGRISGLVGHRRTFLISLIGFAAASALGGAANGTGVLFGARALQGVFAAAMAPAALSLLTLTFTDPKERGKAFGVYGAMGAAGSGVGLLAGGVLTEFLDWRWCLWVNVPIAAIALLGLPYVRRDEGTGSRTGSGTGFDIPGLDIPGVLLSVSGLTALVYGLSQAESRGWTDPLVLVLLFASVVLLVAFVAVEARVRQPLLPLRVLRHRERGAAFLVSALMLAALFGCFLFLSYYAQTVLGYSPVEAGLTIMILVVGSLIGSMLIAGRLLSRVSIRTLMIPGLLAMAAGLLILSFLAADSENVLALYLVPAQLLIGLGLGVVLTAATSLATAEVSYEDMGTASAAFNAGQQVGGAVGTALFNTVATTATAAYLRTHEAGSDAELAGTVDGFGVGLLVAMGIMLLAAVVATVLLRPRRTTEVAAAG